MRHNPASTRVVHLTDYGAPYEGNFVASLRALERRLNADGAEMHYVFPRRAGKAPWLQAMIREKSNVHLIERDGLFAYACQIRRLLKESGATILHEHFIHFPQKMAALFACLSCGHRVRTVLHLHNHIELPKSALLRLPHRVYFRSVSRFICCSRSVAAHLIADGISPERVTVAENAISFERLDEYDSDLRASLLISRETKLALMFGYDFFGKGVDLAIEAARQLRERTQKNAALAIVLSSHREEVLSRITAQLGVPALPEWVMLLPPREDVASYYRMADVFLSPSRQEGFCYALVEAAYCLTPVLASAIDAQRDLALPEGSFFPPCDAAALSDSIERVLAEPNSPSLRERLLQTKRRVVESYSLERWAETVALAYRTVESKR